MKPINYILIITLILLSAFIDDQLYPQNFTNGFNFVLPWNDTTSGNFLPKFPSEAINDFISINQDGHFVINEKQIRFWGINLAADAAFPEKSKAGEIARRLRKMGFNIIRFHHLDNSWSAGSLFEQGKDTRHLNPVTLDRLDYILYLLKKNGIYADINLNVSRTFNALDGVPDGDSLQFNAMGVKVFDPQLIMLQKEFARQFLTHINPYTGLSLADDPLMALLEISNENALYKGWQFGGTKHFSEGGLITWRHKVMLDTLFNSFLKKKYSTTENLAHYWNNGAVDGIKGLQPGESIETKTVKRIDYSACRYFTDARIKDMSEFYIKLQNEYFDEMLSFLKNDLHVKIPIVGTNWNVGSGDLISQSRADYIDNHAYWQHPVFPKIAWSSTDWFIDNTPMVSSAEGGTIADLFAGSAIVNKPYTISEYDHPFPNRYQTEMMIFTTVYSSFHNTDGIMFYDYNDSSVWGQDFVDGFFNMSENHALMSLMPACAYAFRNNLISPAKETIKINYNPDTIYLLPKENNNIFEGVFLFPKKLALIHSVRTGSFSSDSTTNFTSLPQEPETPYLTDTGEITWDTDGLLSVNTNKFSAVSGMLNNFTGTNIGNIQITEANGFGTFTWLLLDTDSLNQTQHSLLSLCSTIQNTGMIWDGTTTVHDNWGSAPTQIQPLVLKLKLNIIADSLRVYPLNVKGNNDINNFKTYYPGTDNLFEITLDQNSDKTLWYGIEAFGITTSYQDKNPAKMYNFNLRQNYPNPFNPLTVISYQLPVTGNVKLKIFDMLGREIATLVNKVQKAGIYKVSFNADNLGSGVYFYKLTAGEFSDVKKMIVIK